MYTAIINCQNFFAPGIRHVIKCVSVCVRVWVVGGRVGREGEMSDEWMGLGSTLFD